MTVPFLGAILLITSRLRLREITAVTLGAALLEHSPALTLPLAAVVGLSVAHHRVRLSSRERSRLQEDAAMLADLTALGLTGGLGIRPALEVAAGAVGGEVAEEVSHLLRKAHVDGIAATLSTAGGAGGELYRVIGRATATGASLVDQMTGVADEMHAELAARQLEKVRKLPVALLFPLALLILPGFLLLTVVPAILDAFLRIDI